MFGLPLAQLQLHARPVHEELLCNATGNRPAVRLAALQLLSKIEPDAAPLLLSMRPAIEALTNSSAEADEVRATAELLGERVPTFHF